MTYPDSYLACPICRVPAGKFCRSLSGAITAGQPDGTVTALDRPHIARKVSKRAGS